MKLIIKEKQLEQLYSVHLIVHEIGHAVDYENRYRMFGTVNTKSFYNLGNERERQEYFLENAFSLWGEYYAETSFLKFSSVKYSRSTDFTNGQSFCAQNETPRRHGSLEYPIWNEVDFPNNNR